MMTPIHSGWGLGRGIPPTGSTLPTSGAPAQPVLPARGAAYQTVVPQRPGTGLNTGNLPARLPTRTTSSTTQTTPAQQLSQINAPLYGSPVAAMPPTPTSTTTTSYLPFILIGAGIVLIIFLAMKR